ncbi:MAG: phytanoyl-CoA dioxygenase family protein [Verrucomicrobiales bacterium]|nr:phytanoyl-CoA dioxygenase family protein [Verrucomicrobiales bacterium]
MSDQKVKILSDQQLRQYQTDGYVILKNHIDLSLLSDLQIALASLMPGGGKATSIEDIDKVILEAEKNDHKFVYYAMIAVGSSCAALQVLASMNVEKITSELYAVPAKNIHLLPIQTPIQIPGDTRFDQDWHQDGTSYPAAEIIPTFWFPVLHPTRETGSVGYIPGSHKRGERDSVHTVYESGLNVRVITVEEQEKQDAVVADLELGDLLVFDKNLVHTSTPNKGGIPRATGICRTVVLDGDKEFTPLFQINMESLGGVTKTNSQM